MENSYFFDCPTRQIGAQPFDDGLHFRKLRHEVSSGTQPLSPRELFPAYITPELLGGGKELMIGNLIALQFGSSRNWPFGSAAALILMAVVMIALLVYVRYSGKEGARHG